MKSVVNQHQTRETSTSVAAALQLRHLRHHHKNGSNGGSRGGGDAASAAASAAVSEEMQLYFSKLKQLVPFMPKNKKLSKLEIIQYVIDYICDLQLALESHPPHHQRLPTTAAPHQSAGSGSSSSSSSPSSSASPSPCSSPNRQPLGVLSTAAAAGNANRNGGSNGNTNSLLSQVVHELETNKPSSHLDDSNTRPVSC